MALRSNRTFMELKWNSSWFSSDKLSSSNRTFMELKLSFLLSHTAC